MSVVSWPLAALLLGKPGSTLPSLGDTPTSWCQSAFLPGPDECFQEGCLLAHLPVSPVSPAAPPRPACSLVPPLPGPFPWGPWRTSHLSLPSLAAVPRLWLVKQLPVEMQAD